MAEKRSAERLKTTTERTSDREIVITRTFAAPAQLLFDAWTKAELVRRWWAPASRGVVMAECEADVRVGGTYRYVLARGPKERLAFFGRYVEITRPTRLVYTQTFEPMPDGEAVITVRFEPRGAETTLIAHELYPSKEVLDGTLASGMEDGMLETYAQLDQLLKTVGAP